MGEKYAGVFVTRWIQKLSRSFVGNSAKTTFPYSYVVAVSIILYEYVLVTQGRNMLAIRVITRVAGGPKSGAYDSMGVLSLFAVSSSLCCPLPLFLSSTLYPLLYALILAKYYHAARKLCQNPHG